MKLSSYLRRYKNIAWYPSAGRDVLSMTSLSFDVLKQFGINKEEIPDCFLFTDYDSFARYNDRERFVLDLPEDENQIAFGYDGTDYHATAFNVEELENIDIPCRQEMIAGEPDEYYGRVYVADILVEHPRFGKVVSKLIYVIAENTAFCFDYLLRNRIKIKYLIHSRYGHGFGGGFSSGLYMVHLLKELGVEYYASDMDETAHGDCADQYLTEEQKQVFPVLQEICDFSIVTNWCGYDATKLYKVLDFRVENDNRRLGFFDE